MRFIADQSCILNWDTGLGMIVRLDAKMGYRSGQYSVLILRLIP